MLGYRTLSRHWANSAHRATIRTDADRRTDRVTAQLAARPVRGDSGYTTEAYLADVEANMRAMADLASRMRVGRG